jgi:hypothetical protein
MIPTFAFLDAEDAGAKRSTIADALFSNVDAVYPENRRLKAFGNARVEARRLRDHGYRGLAVRAHAALLDDSGS